MEKHSRKIEQLILTVFSVLIIAVFIFALNYGEAKAESGRGGCVEFCGNNGGSPTYVHACCDDDWTYDACNWTSSCSTSTGWKNVWYYSLECCDSCSPTSDTFCQSNNPSYNACYGGDVYNYYSQCNGETCQYTRGNLVADCDNYCQTCKDGSCVNKPCGIPNFGGIPLNNRLCDGDGNCYVCDESVPCETSYCGYYCRDMDADGTWEWVTAQACTENNLCQMAACAGTTMRCNMLPGGGTNWESPPDSHCCSNASCGSDMVCLDGTCEDPDQNTIACTSGTPASVCSSQWSLGANYWVTSGWDTSNPYYQASCCGDDVDECASYQAPYTATICQRPYYCNGSCCNNSDCTDCGLTVIHCPGGYACCNTGQCVGCYGRCHDNEGHIDPSWECYPTWCYLDDNGSPIWSGADCPAGQVCDYENHKCEDISDGKPPTLSVSLSAVPSSGDAPLDVDLTANVSGTATGTINYAFWKNCDDPCNTMSGCQSACGSWDAKYDNESAESKTYHANYSSAGSFKAKVVVERDAAAPAESRASVTVSAPSCVCENWIPRGCGISPCALNEMKLERTCTPPGCNLETDCVVSSVCYHNECNQDNQCVSVPGAGANQCENDKDCQPKKKKWWQWWEVNP